MTVNLIKVSMVLIEAETVDDENEDEDDTDNYNFVDYGNRYKFAIKLNETSL